MLREGRSAGCEDLRADAALAARGDARTRRSRFALPTLVLASATALTMMRPLALFGGTFDPIHNAHLRVAWEAAEHLDAEVRLLPASVPPHRGQPVASASERVALVRAALTGQDRLSVDARELRREGASYTVDTLIEVREESGPERPLVLLVGADAFAGLPQWHRWKELFDLAHIGVLTRPGYEGALPTDLRTKIASRRCSDVRFVQGAPAGRVLTIPVTPLDVSASAIRALLAEGRDPRWLVPDAFFAHASLLDPYRTRD